MFCIGVVYTGYCIDILKAIQRKVKTLGAELDYELYEVADNTYGIFDEETNQWTGLVGDIVQGKGKILLNSPRKTKDCWQEKDK